MAVKKVLSKKKVVTRKKAAAKKKVVKKKVAAKKKVTASKSTDVTSKPKTPSKPLPNIKYPKTIGKMVDAIYDQQQKIAEVNKKLSAEKEILAALEDHAFHMFAKDDLDGSRGKKAQASISRSIVPQVEDPAAWDKVFAYIIKNKDFSVLQKRLGVTHIRDLWENGEEIPGVAPFPRVTLSVTKVKAKK